MTTLKRYAPHLGTAARKRALAAVGDRYPAGWCLRWVASIFGVPGVGDWDKDGAADAEDFYKAAVAKGTFVKQTDPAKIPADRMILWTGGGRDHGHAAYSLGGGMMVSTDLPTSGRIGKVKISSAWKNLQLRGYVEVDGNGYHYKKPAATKTTKYRVVTKAGVNVRAAANTSSAVKSTLTLGKTVAVSDTKQVGMRIWGRVPAGWVCIVDNGKALLVRA